MNYPYNLCLIKLKDMELVAEKQQVKTNGNHFMPKYKNGVQHPKNQVDMVISVEKKIAQPSNANVSDGDKCSIGTEELKTMFENVLIEKRELENCTLNWLDNKTVVTERLSGIALHNFLLKAEQLGKNVTYTKKTVIEIH